MYNRGRGDAVELPISYWDHTFIRFDLSTLISPVHSARLRVYYSDSDTNEVFVSPMVNDDWSETGTMPEKETGSSEPLGQVTTDAEGYFEVDVTSFVAAERAGDGLASFELWTELWSWSHLASRESAAPPQLVVDSGYPEPPVLTSMSLAPAEAQLESGQSVTFVATGRDQFDQVVSVAPVWSVTGGGVMDANGLFQASLVGGPYTVSAEYGAVSATASVVVLPEGYRIPSLVISEIHYHPTEGGDFEFIEITNTEDETVDLQGFAMTDGIEYVFPAGSVIDAGQRILLVKLASSYSGLSVPLYQWTSGSLDNGGETLTLSDSFGGIVDSVTYGDAGDWYVAADGYGPSLELTGLTLDNADPASWQASSVLGGTPGESTSSADPVLVRAEVTPVDAEVLLGDTLSFKVLGYDQFDNAMAMTAVWSVSGGGGVDGNGVFSADALGGPYAVSATQGSVNATAEFTVVEALSAPAHIVINEIHYNPLEGDGYEFLELYNAGAESVDLSGFEFTKGINYAFPEGSGIAPGQFVVVAVERARYSGRGYDVYQWTNGSLSNGGEALELANAEGVVVDSVKYDDEEGWTSAADGQGPSLELNDVSLDNAVGENWRESGISGGSPGAANTPARLPVPDFSLQGGLYSGSQTLTISTSVSGAKVGYTTDGSEPTSGSGSSVTITVNESTVVRARTYKSGAESSHVKTHTYLVGEDTALPVVSVSIDPAELYGGDGLFVDIWSEDYRPVNVEFFDESRVEQFNQQAELKLHGGSTRQMAMKSLVLKARKYLGVPTLNYKFFREREEDKFKNVLIHTTGQDQNYGMMRDPLFQGMVEGRMDVDSMGSRPVLFFLNGDYMGIRYIRDRMNNDYPDTYYGLNDEDIVIEAWDDGELEDIKNYVQSHDMSTSTALEGIRELMDVDEFMNIYTVEIFTANTDWPSNNSKAWRDISTMSPWRWMLYDLDLSFGIASKVDYNSLFIAQDSTNSTGRNPPNSTVVFRKLMENPVFRKTFGQRFMSHLNSTFDQGRLETFVDRFAAEIDAEVPRHFEMWARTEWPWSTQNYSDWLEELDKIKNFGEARRGVLHSQFVNYYTAKGDSSGLATLTLQNNAPDGGQIYVNGVEMLPGAEVSGQWFKSIPLTIIAQPPVGQTFVRWEGASSSTHPEITLSLTGDATLKAVFSEALAELPALVISEIHYHPIADADEFLEIYNVGSASVDLSGFSMEGVDFEFPQGASISAGEIILLAIDETVYAGSGRQVFQWTDGKLSNGGEVVAILDVSGQVVDQVECVDSGDWPTSPDGDGYSLELVDVILDNSLVSSWRASGAIGGSPGAL